MTRADAQQLLDAVAPGVVVNVTAQRGALRPHRVIAVHVEWGGKSLWRSTEATALRALVREVYVARGLAVPEAIPQQRTLPGAES